MCPIAEPPGFGIGTIPVAQSGCLQAVLFGLVGLDLLHARRKWQHVPRLSTEQLAIGLLARRSVGKFEGEMNMEGWRTSSAKRVARIFLGVSLAISLCSAPNVAFSEDKVADVSSGAKYSAQKRTKATRGKAGPKAATGVRKPPSRPGRSSPSRSRRSLRWWGFLVFASGAIRQRNMPARFLQPQVPGWSCPPGERTAPSEPGC